MSRAPGKPAAGPVTDGRRRRGLDNRAKIVAALMEIVRSGEVAPGAEQVAARADVGLRTVFRHFQDMDSLYSEVSALMEREFHAVAARVDRFTLTRRAASLMGASETLVTAQEQGQQQAGRAARHRRGVISVEKAKRMLATPLLDWERTLQKAFDDRPEKEGKKEG